MARVRQIQVRAHGLLSTVLQGAYRSTFRGTGIEFEEVRPYQPGDEVRSIDWNVTARTGAPHIKTYIEERQLVLQLVVDSSLSMDFGTLARTKREVAAEVAALLSFVAAANQDQVGLSLFADEPGLHLEPDAGHRHVLRVVREIFAAHPTGSGSSLERVLENQLRHLKRRALVVIISDFLGEDPESWRRTLAKLGQRHDVICVRVYDPFEEELPKSGVIRLEDVESGRELEIDTGSRAVRDRWRADALERTARLASATRRAGIDLVHVATNEEPDVAEPIVRCFQKRARQGAAR